MKLMFTPQERFQLITVFQEIAESKEIKMSGKEAKVMAEIIKRLETGSTNKFKKEAVEALRFVVHQILEYRENLDTSEVDEDTKKFWAMENNIFLMIMDKLNSKLDKESKRLNDIVS